MTTRSAAGLALTLAVLLTASVAAQADVLDLATSTNGMTPDTMSGTFGDVLFVWTTNQPTGTGTIQTFVQVQAQGNNTTERGYNTTVNNVFDNGASDEFNHALALADIPIVNIGGTDYRQFLLDVNESLGQGGELISLNEIQVLQSNVANPNVTTFTNDVLDIPSHTFVFRLDDGVDNTIELNAALGTGSGSGDMFMYIPNDLFAPDVQYVYLYSEFGTGNGVSDGFEEWSVIGQNGDESGQVIPEPASLSLMGSGLVAMATLRLRRRR